MEIIIKEVFSHPMINGGKKEITKLVIQGDNYEQCFKKIYDYERSARYNNYVYYDFDDLNLKETYKEWKKTSVTISMYYGGGVVD